MSYLLPPVPICPRGASVDNPHRLNGRVTEDEEEDVLRPEGLPVREQGQQIAEDEQDADQRPVLAVPACPRDVEASRHLNRSSAAVIVVGPAERALKVPFL